jgi:Tfp pilus assembly protein PilF/O-antigen ligase
MVMNNDPSDRTYVPSRIFETGWLIAAVLVPLTFNPWGLNPFTPPKVAVLRTVVFGLTVTWAILVLASPRHRRTSAWTSPLLVPALALIGVQMAATALAVNPAFSLWGSVERGQGLLTVICYPLLGLIVAVMMRSTAQAYRLVAAVQLTAVPIVILAIAQIAGLDLGLLTDARSPVLSTLGRSNFVAAYLAMLMPLTLVQTASAAGRRPRLAWGLLLAAEGVVLVLTRVRAGWFAALVGLAVVLVLWFRRDLAMWWRRPALRVAVVAAGAGSTAAVIALARAGGSGAARLAIWQACLRLVFERPFLGYGPDALLLVFPRFYPPELVYHQGRGFLVDRAHDFLLDWSVAFGVLGLVAWLAVLWAVASTGIRQLGRDETGTNRNAIVIAALAAIAANTAGNFFSFDVTTTSTLTWLLLGTIVAMAAAKDRSASAESGRLPTWRRAVLVPLGIGLAAAILLFNLRPVVADVWMRRAHSQLAEGTSGAAVLAAEHAVRWWPREAQYFLRLAAISEQHARRDHMPESVDLETTETALLHAIALQPQRFDFWLELARLYTRWPGELDPEISERAHAAFGEAVRLAPQNATVFGSWGGWFLDQRNPAAAEGMFRKAVDLDATDVAAWTRLGEVQLGRGRPAEAAFSFERALEIAPDLTPALVGMAGAQWRMGDVEGAAATVERALEVEPENQAALDLADRFDGQPTPPH